MAYEDLKYKRFNDSLDENGDIVIAGISFAPSRILFDMDAVAYEAAYNEFQEQAFDELKDVIYNSYPSCIAYNFRLSEKGEGATDPVRKLLHLKDTWESVVFMLFALVMGEVRHKSINLKAATVFKSFSPTGTPVYVSFNTRDHIVTDAIKPKIHAIKAVVTFSKANGLGLQCEAIEEALLDKLLELQDIRNDISHHTAPTPEEAEAELMQVVPLFKEMLVLTEFLQECRILRFENFATKCKCEEFNGHALNKEFGEFDFGTQQPYVLSLGQEQLFVEWNGEVYSISPFMHYDKDATGRKSYLSFYKGKKAGKFWYEPLTKRTEITFDPLQPRFDAEQATLVTLIVP